MSYTLGSLHQLAATGAQSTPALFNAVTWSGLPSFTRGFGIKR